MRELLQFKKQRELGDILTDTFKFIRLQGKDLFTLILKITGPALVILILSYVYYMYATLGSFENIFIQASSFEGFAANVILSVILMIFAMIAFYTLLHCTVLCYIQSYINNDGVVSEQEVRDGVKASFWSMLGSGVLINLMVVIGFLFCGIPGIYLGVVLASTYSIIIFERRDVMDAIGYSFSLIKGEWWITFATYLVMFILFYIIMIVFQIPQYIYFFVKSFALSEEVSANPADFFDWVYVALTSIGMIAQYLLYTLIIITTCFIYFNLNEKKNYTGTIEAINSIGNRE